MMTVLRKSTVRPWPSVRRPSSSSCSSDVEHVGVGLLDLVEQHHRVGAPAHRLGELAALVVADVAGRRADQARHRVLLHVLGHVDADHVRLVVEQELGERARQLGLARRRSGPRKMNEPIGPVGILQARRGRGGRRWRPPPPPRPGRSRARAGAPPCCSRRCLLALQHLVDGDAGPLRHHGGDVLLGDLLAQERRRRFCAAFELVVLGGSSAFSSSGSAAEAQLGGAVRIAARAAPARPRSWPPRSPP